MLKFVLVPHSVRLMIWYHFNSRQFLLGDKCFFSSPSPLPCFVLCHIPLLLSHIFLSHLILSYLLLSHLILSYLISQSSLYIIWWTAFRLLFSAFSLLTSSSYSLLFPLLLFPLVILFLILFLPPPLPPFFFSFFFSFFSFFFFSPPRSPLLLLLLLLLLSGYMATLFNAVGIEVMEIHSRKSQVRGQRRENWCSIEKQKEKNIWRKERRWEEARA